MPRTEPEVCRARLLLVLLTLTGPVPFRVCTCGAHDHGADTDGTHEHEHHHSPDCPVCNPPPVKPAALTAPTDAPTDSSVSLDFPAPEPLAGSGHARVSHELRAAHPPPDTPRYITFRTLRN